MSSEDTTRLEALLAEQEALRRVATLVAADTPPGELFDHVCEELGLLLGVQSTDIIRYEEEGWATIVGAWVGSGEVSFPVGERIPVEGESVTARIWRTESPQRVDDYEGIGGELVRRLLSFGIRSVVGAPVHVAGRLWGGVMVTSSDPNAFPPDTEQRICDFAELVTAALANADGRAQLAASRARIVTAADEARRRIERDLHDGAQQRLVSLALSLRLLHSQIEPDSEASRELEAARAELDLALEELRELARGIHPSVLTDRGLEAALSGLASRSPIPVGLDLADGSELPRCLQTTAYFVAAEGITNAIKHARCSSVRVRVKRAGDEALIEVSDDGVGGVEPDSGSGLRGLGDRVSALGGELELDSEPGQGTTVRARLAVGESQRLAGTAA
jgi:signal transduction histidine kinase